MVRWGGGAGGAHFRHRTDGLSDARNPAGKPEPCDLCAIRLAIRAEGAIPAPRFPLIVLLSLVISSAIMLSLLGAAVSQKTRKSFLLEIRLALAAFTVAAPAMIYLVVAYLNLDLWWDEVYSLDFFVFVLLKTVVTDYHLPNNHIFANLLNHIYVYSLGLDDISLLENPWKIRILMLVYAVITSIWCNERSARIALASQLHED